MAERGRRPPAGAVGRVACAMLVAAPLAAQVPEPADTAAPRAESSVPRREELAKRRVRGVELAPGAIRCSGERITTLSFDRRPPGFTGRSAASRVANFPIRAVHRTTRPHVLNPYLLLEVGDVCSEPRRLESERILRQLPFIQDAQVAAFPDGAGGVHLVVRTVDEFSFVASPALSGTSLIGGRVGTTNLAGEGVRLEFGTRTNTVLRDEFTVRLRTAYLGRHPIQSALTWSRFGLGQTLALEVRKPFLTDFQRVAWRASLGTDEDYVRFQRPEDPIPFQLARRSYGSLGGVRRFGSFGRTVLLGALFTQDAEGIGESVLVDSIDGKQPFPAPLPTPAAPPRTVSRLALLAGARAVRFLPVEGFDALTGTQDLRLGVQWSAQLGRALPGVDRTLDSFYFASDFYAGWGTSRWFAGTELFMSGRHGPEAWDGRVISGRSALYLRDNSRALTLLEAQYVGAERMRVPFQLTLGDGQAGLLGYRRAREGGEARLRLRAEQRQLVGRPFGFVDVAFALFGETGRLWAGDAPFGVDTPWRHAVGIGLLTALPPGSRRTTRLDLVWPLNRGPGVSTFELRVTTTDFARFFWRDPIEARRGRERTIYADPFTF